MFTLIRTTAAVKRKGHEHLSFNGYKQLANFPQHCGQLSFPHGIMPPIAPQLPGKVTPFFPIGNAARKCQKSKKLQSQTYKTPSERKSPQWFQTRENWKQNDIKTPCERMIHLCFGTIPPLFEKARDPNVQNNITKKNIKVLWRHFRLICRSTRRRATASQFLQQILLAKFCSSSNKASNSPAATLS